MIPFFALERQYAQVGEELLHHTDLILRSGKLMDGEYATKLEEWIKVRTGAACAILVHSGTQALELLAYALKPPPDVVKPRVLIPNITYVATANAFIKAGYNIIFGDVDYAGIMFTYDSPSENYYISCGVGLYGADPRADDVIDGAQSWLNGYMNSEYMTISFDPTKNLNASGNGGAIVLNDHVTAASIRRMRDNNKGTRFQLDFGLPATNSKMSEIDCAHVLVRAKYIDQWQSRRRQIAEYYNEKFLNLPLRSLIELSSVSGNVKRHQIQKYVVRAENTEQRDKLQAYLKERDIETRIHYEKCLSDLPVYEGYLTVKTGVESSKKLASEVLSLPMYPELTDSEVEYIAKSVQNFYKNK